MFDGLKGMFSSKKFWLSVVGSGVVTGLSLAHVPTEIVLLVGSIFGINVAAQGYADGKK